jgi:hypothetical protein
MTDAEFQAVLIWFIASDPWPASVNRAVIYEWLNRESKARGFENWTDAYHGIREVQK